MTPNRVPFLFLYFLQAFKCEVLLGRQQGPGAKTALAFAIVDRAVYLQL